MLCHQIAPGSDDLTVAHTQKASPGVCAPLLLHHLEVGRLLKSSLLEPSEQVEDIPVVDENALVNNQLVIDVRIKPASLRPSKA